MRLDIGNTDIPTAGTRVRLSSDGGLTVDDRVLWAQFRGLPANTGAVYVGIADVSATHGWPLEKTDTVGLILNFRILGGAVKAGDIYFDAAINGDDVAWALILEQK